MEVFVVEEVAEEATVAAKQNQHITVFTDGACSGNPGPGGWGAILSIPSLNQVCELGGADHQTTNNRMEMLASIEALRRIESSLKSHPEKIHEQEINLYTDSTYIIRGITQWIFAWKRRGWVSSQGEPVLNQDLWQELDALIFKLKRSRLPVHWIYVRGHSGNPGNERCDQIAVLFSQGLWPSLYSGPSEGYSIDLSVVPEKASLPPMSSKSSSTEKKPPHSYLSLVDGRAFRHKTWSQCEARVKNRKGALFKKAKSAEEEQGILRGWNYTGPVEDDI